MFLTVAKFDVDLINWTQSHREEDKVYNHGRTGPSGNLALARWAVWYAGLVGRHAKC